ncbi:amino acid adenylation domain-containing protein [Ktedonobacter robiniae]|uniref:Carrier domain-containing protein n=1 Tax=Ktedonobacter robiniae TaxID=2778365 RepID=A0ABQ3UXT6_9CHLR|nr:non-ribosomal peptide synthetase [Ktedonobacter robiniae]GHO57487.1 hypothetical protein KSB_59620 [Ktedonobacter robiniae]
MTRVISRIRALFSVDLSLRHFFAAPTITALAQLLSHTRYQEQASLLPTLAPVPRDHPLPLSFGQQRLWFLDQFSPLDASYNMTLAFSCQGPLHLSALAHSLQDLILRHEVLHTTFASLDGDPIQVIAPLASLPPHLLSCIDLSALPSPLREATAHALRQQDAHAPFLLAEQFPIRLHVLRLSPHEHHLILTMHHIASDGWSMDLLLQELGLLYHAHLTGTTALLPTLSVQYADYALWQRQWLQTPLMQQQLAYWKQQLVDAPALLELPIDHPRPPVQQTEGAQYAFTLPTRLHPSLAELCRQCDCTPFMFFLSTFLVLLQRYSGQQDLVVGTPIANRTRPEVAHLIGFFVNTLALRLDLSADPSFQTLLQQVKSVTLQAYEHQDLPFEQVVEALHPQRMLSHSPLFQVMFLFQPQAAAPISLAEISTRRLPIEVHATKFDLSLIIEEEAGTLQATLEYRTDLFEAATIERLACSYEVLVSDILAHPACPISRLEILPEQERRQLIQGWQSPQLPAPMPSTLHVLFEQRAEQTPDAIAAICNEEQISYQTLNRYADLLAGYLRARKIGPESLVGVCLQRSVTMLVALLGILKAGGAYVPIDPTHPSERIAFMLADSQVTLVLTQSTLRTLLPAQGPTMIALDQQWEQITQTEPGSPSLTLSDANLAYVIYTSGSTGKPKGVLGTHGAIVNRLQWMWRTMPFTAQDICCQKTNLSFVDAVSEIFGPLLQGVPLVILTDEVVKDPPRLREQLAQYAVSRIVLVPSLLRVLLQEEDAVLQTQLHRLTHWTSSGEALPVDLIQRFRQCLPAAHLFNLYGSSEVAADATSYQIGNESSDQATAIGYPIDQMQVYILDTFLQPVPIGVTGEIYIGGAGLARGYWQRPELTAERFVPDIVSGHAGTRLYRTGDLGCRRSDGALIYLGRTDHQIKLRGFRIELGEIEAVIRQHPTIREAVAIVREDRTDDKRLIAYMTTAGEETIKAESMRQFLQQSLPEYMVPSAFVFLDHLPLSPNGKLDRRQLPAPDLSTQIHDDAFVAPRSPIELTLASIWADVLALPQQQISVSANFFSLGGHSLLVTRVISRIRALFSVDLSLRHFFAAPTITALAQLLSHTRYQEQASLLPTLAPVPRDHPLPLSFGQQRLWFLDQFSPLDASYNMTLAFSCQGPLHLSALAHSLQDLILRHEVLHTTFASLDGDPIQVIAPLASLPPHLLSCIDLSALPSPLREATAHALRQQDAHAPFLLAEQFPIRLHVLRLSPHEHHLILTMHHIASDGWSMDLLLQELGLLYHAHLTGTTALLPTLSVQYADYALWQRQWLQTPLMQQQLAYWKQQLVDAPALLELPIDHPRPPVQQTEGAQYAFTLPTRLHPSLAELCRQCDCTPFMFFLSTFLVLLQRYSGQQDLVVGTPIANRTRPEVAHLIGFFVNTLALRLDLSADPSFQTLLQQVKSVTLQAYEHQDLPFEQVVEALHPQRMLSHSPLFQVMFLFQPQAAAPISLAEISTRRLPIEVHATKFDLSLIIEEEAGTLQATLEYRTDLFEAATIERLARSYEVLVSDILAHPACPISRLEILPEQERRQLIQGWQSPQLPVPMPSTLHVLFEQRAEQTPDAIALIFGDQQLTYQHLNAQANQLAHYVRRQGGGPETLVGIAVERSPDMLIALLAVLKSGGAYLPLDPSYPSDRLSFMLHDAQISLLLTQQHLLPRLPASSCAYIALDGIWLELSNEAPENLSLTIPAHSLAYMIYTSGSTGQPKGVQIEHQGLFYLAQAQQEIFAIQPQDRILQFASLSFDASVFEISLALTAGATLVLGAREALLPGSDLQHFLTQYVITHATLPPSVLATLDCNVLSGLHMFISAGEALPKGLADQVAKTHRLYNAYGPTEATVWATGAHYTPDQNQPPLIGPAINHAQTYVLNAQLQPVPIGVAGELYLGGVGIARGYRNQAMLTAERFIPHPFSDKPGARLYKTGDLVRYRENGALEFLSRLDHQVKIRGFRIELGEIEAVLHRHPAIHECVVISHKQPDDETLLLAYFTTQMNQVPSSMELRQFLYQQLPQYMLPSAFIHLSAFPHTPNDKLDLAALPLPTHAPHGSQQNYTPPRDTIELQLVRIWEELLPHQTIGITDNFFELGGHSLLAIRLMAHIQHAFQQQFPLSTLFQHATIEHLASLIHQQDTQQPRSILVPMRTSGEKYPFFCVHPIGGEVFCYLDIARDGDQDRPFYALQSPDPDSWQTTQPRLQDLAARYIKAMYAVQPTGPYHLGGWSLGGVIAFEMAQQLQQQGHTVRTLTLFDSYAPGHFSDEQSIVSEFLHDLEGLSGKHVSAAHLNHHHTHPQEQVRSILEQAQRAGIFPPELDTASLLRLFSTFQQNKGAFQHYTPRPYFGKLLFFQASHLPEGTPGTAASSWQQLTLPEFSLSTVQGTHYTMMQHPNSQTLAQLLSASLDHADA